MCHSSQDPPTFAVTYEQTTRIANAQWNRRTGASQMREGAAAMRLLGAVVVVAGLAAGAGIRDRLLEGREVAHGLRQLPRLGDHLVHLGVEVLPLLPDLGLGFRLALVGAVAEESLRVVGEG